MRFIPLAALAILAATHITSQAAADASQPPIRIGAIFPLTGGSSDMGRSALIGAQTAIDEINAAGGYLGRPLQLVVRDSPAEQDGGRKAAEELVQKEKVVATVGFCNTGAAVKALDIFQNAQHVLIVPCATGSDITSKYPASQSYIFRNAPNDLLQVQFLIDDIMKRGHRRIALAVDTSGYGDGGLRDLQAAIQKAGLPAPTVARFDVGTSSVTDELTKLKQSGADVLIGWSVGPEEGLIGATRAALNWQVPFFGPWGLSHASAYQRSRGAVEGGYMVQTLLPNAYRGPYQSFLNAYVRQSTERPIGSLMSAAQTHDAVHLLLRAIFESNNNLSGPSLKAALENLKKPYYGVVTTYRKPFSNTNHEAVTAEMLWLGTWRNGEREYANKTDMQKALILQQKVSGPGTTP